MSATPSPPPLSAVAQVDDYILYTSSFVDQLYYHVYDTVSGPANVPKRYFQWAATAHLLSSGEVDYWTTASDEARYVGIEGDLTVQRDPESDDMYSNTLRADRGVQVHSYGSIENYAAPVQATVQLEGEFTAENVWGMAMQFNRAESASTDHPLPVHFLFLSALSPTRYQDTMLE